MNQTLVFSDYLVFIIYFIIVSGYGYWVYQRKKKAVTDTKDFFLAEGSLTWWAIGASLIASNISAEQFIGMSGEGYFVGIAVAAYEWIAAIALIIIAVWFIPIYLKNKIYTMPQFLKTRYNETVALIMAVFWLFLYIFVNLTSILYLGAVAINGLVGGVVTYTYDRTRGLCTCYYTRWYESNWIYRCNPGGCFNYWWSCNHIPCVNHCE
jgi:SSS family solute:Na+ symporter